MLRADHMLKDWFRAVFAISVREVFWIPEVLPVSRLCEVPNCNLFPIGSRIYSQTDLARIELLPSYLILLLYLLG